MPKAEFTICPIDQHLCPNRRCIEREKKGEQDCRVAADHLVKAAEKLSPINELFMVANDRCAPTLEELARCVNLSEAVIDVSGRLGVSKLPFMLEIVSQLNNREERKSSKLKKKKKK